MQVFGRLLALSMAFAGMIGISGLTASTVRAADGDLLIELNQLKDVSGACRASFVIRNDLGTPVSKLAMEIVLFDKQEKIMSLLAIDAGSLTQSKTRVKQFDLKDLSCGAIGSLLLNDITTCEGTSLTPAACLEKAKLAHKTEAPFRR